METASGFWWMAFYHKMSHALAQTHKHTNNYPPYSLTFPVSFVTCSLLCSACIRNMSFIVNCLIIYSTLVFGRISTQRPNNTNNNVNDKWSYILILWNVRYPKYIHLIYLFSFAPPNQVQSLAYLLNKGTVVRQII